MAEQFSPTMRAAIDLALEHGNGIPADAVLIRFPGGFWSYRGWRLHEGKWFGATTIEALVKRGAGEYTKWQLRKRPRPGSICFPTEVRITL